MPPIYEFACDKCEHSVEVLQKHSDPPPKCSRCHDLPDMKKQISRSSFRLEGYSWGKNGYGNRPPWDAPRATKD